MLTMRRQAEKEAQEAAQRAAEGMARRLQAAGFYPVEQTKARAAEAAATARKIAAQEAQEVLDRIRREEEAEQAARRDAVTEAVASKTVQFGKGLALSALNFISDQLSKAEARSATPKPELTSQPPDSGLTGRAPGEETVDSQALVANQAAAQTQEAAAAASAAQQEEEKLQQVDADAAAVAAREALEQARVVTLAVRCCLDASCASLLYLPLLLSPAVCGVCVLACVCVCVCVKRVEGMSRVQDGEGKGGEGQGETRRRGGV